MTTAKKYAFVTYLVGEDFKKVRAMQKDISAMSGAQKCLVDWQPHITIGQSVFVSDQELPVIQEALKNLCDKQKTITARINGFGKIDNWSHAAVAEGKATPYIVYLDVEVREDLMAIYNSVNSEIVSKFETASFRIGTYEPHVTLSFVDLPEDGYRKAVEYLESKDLDMDFSISHIALVECYGEIGMDSAICGVFNFN